MPLPRFVGRRAELAALRTLLDGLDRPDAVGRVVLVSADPGVGKTRLLREVTEFARARRRRPALVLVGRGSPLASTIPLAIVAEPLGAHLESLAARERDTLPALPDLTAGDVGPRLETFAAIRRLLSALAVDRPLVLILDDLHLADRLSWDLVAYLGRIAPAAPVLVLAAARVAALAEIVDLTASVGALVRDGVAEEIQLAPLSQDEVAELAGTLLGPAAVDGDLVSWLHRRAQGNALLTVELLGELASDPSARAAVPLTVTERVRRLRAALPDSARRALDVAAVMGHTFDVAMITPLLGSDAVGALELLVRERLLVERPDGYDFTHPLMQEAVYIGLGAARRRELHVQVGRALVVAPLAVRAYHIGRGALPGDLAAVAVLREAAGEAVRAAAPREALGHLSTALSLTPLAEVGLRRAILDDVAWQATVAPDHEAGIVALRELIELSGDDPTSQARGRMRMASFLSTGAADVAAAEREATAAVDLLRTTGTPADLAAALNERAWIRGMAGDFAGQLEGCREALAMVAPGADDRRASRSARAETGSADVAGVVLHTIGPMGAVLAMLGDFDGARRCHAESRALALATNDPGQIGWHSAVASLTELFAGRFVDAAAVVDPAVDPAPLRADIATPWRTLTNWFLGRWQLGRRDCLSVRELFPVTPSAHMAWSFAMAALFEAGTSDAGTSTPGEVDAWAGPARRAYQDRDLYFFAAVCRWALGSVHWLAGELEPASVLLRRCAQWLRSCDAVGLECLLAAELPDVLAGLGELDEAQAAAERVGELCDRLGTPFAAAQAAYTRSLVAAARRQRAVAAQGFAQAAAGYDACSAPFLRARALEHRAGVVDAATALTDLSAAARLYATLPAPACRDRVLARMRTGGSAGRRAAQQVGALTPREQEIARMAARGLATVEIAERLRLSGRTVESHLGRIYRKLGIDGRPGLAGALERASRTN